MPYEPPITSRFAGHLLRAGVSPVETSVEPMEVHTLLLRDGTDARHLLEHATNLDSSRTRAEHVGRMMDYARNDPNASFTLIGSPSPTATRNTPYPENRVWSILTTAEYVRGDTQAVPLRCTGCDVFQRLLIVNGMTPAQVLAYREWVRNQ